MPNSDNTYGTFNKKTIIMSQSTESPVTFADIATAKSHFFTDAALAIFDECCTQLEWTIVDSTKLKYTMAFGTKGGNITAADDWAGQFNSRSSELLAIDAANAANVSKANNTPPPLGWAKVPFTQEDSNSHLF